MPKNSPEENSRENYENTEGALGAISGAIGETHKAYAELAKPHIELLEEQEQSVYPFQPELDALVSEEESIVAPLVKKSLELETKLKRLQSLAWDEALETEKIRAYREEYLPQVETFNGTLDELESEMERVNSLIRDAHATGYKLEGLLKKDHTTREEDVEIAEYFAVIIELVPKISDLKHRLVHSKLSSSDT